MAFVLVPLLCCVYSDIVTRVILWGYFIQYFYINIKKILRNTKKTENSCKYKEMYVIMKINIVKKFSIRLIIWIGDYLWKKYLY